MCVCVCVYVCIYHNILTKYIYTHNDKLIYMFWQWMGGIVLGMFTCVVLFNPPNIPLRCFITIPIFQESKLRVKEHV